MLATRSVFDAFLITYGLLLCQLLTLILLVLLWFGLIWICLWSADVGRSSTGGRFLNNVYNTRTFQDDLGKPAQSHAWSSFGSGRASVGEIYNPVRFLGLLSEGTLNYCLTICNFPWEMHGHVVIIVFVLRWSRSWLGFCLDCISCISKTEPSCLLLAIVFHTGTAGCIV